jgi:hypothetical protein
MPLQTQNFTTNPGAFTLNGDGSITVNQSGTYLITSKIQSSDNNDVNGDDFSISINGNTYNRQQLQSAQTVHGGNNITGITTVLNVNAGEKLTLMQTKGYTGGGTLGGSLFGLGGIYGARGGNGGATLTTNPGGNPVATPSLALTITRVQ